MTDNAEVIVATFIRIIATFIYDIIYLCYWRNLLMI